ncbi:uncharacterized protein LOC120636764 [Pararge aegeria]|uniref:uncharacterized protein LOC120636756 n=1 Tax=Pararge aegeria TaxID=116150 RepID=UPI0019D1E1E4|nr:uncharacterized protein LOC120636756 [Pararge aegeria]XP_039764260.1 uncharacterized protein LOC120636764 [Pararge aegeria]
MDGFTNSKIEKQTIYEIYRACRLCGAGAGYKMPIIKNVVDLDSGEVELKQKVRECVQIEVHQDDKMPPLICKLCVDKVNDFYEFLEMCRQTNKRTRLRLGLPPQTLPRGAPDAGDCILGVTEPIFVDNEDSNEPILRSKSKSVKSVKVKKEPESRESRNKKDGKEHKSEKEKERDERRSERDKFLHSRVIKKEGCHDSIEPRTLRRRAASPPSSPPDSPARLLRGTKRHHDDDVSLSSIQKSKRSDETTPRSILKRDRESVKSVDSTKVTRSREKENEKLFNSKKVKIVINKMSLLPKPPSPKPQPKPSPHSMLKCKVCKSTFDNSRSLSNHMKSHPHSKPVERKASPPPPPRKELKKIECKQCKREFNARSLMKIHRCNANAVKTAAKAELVQRPVSKPVRISTPKRRSQEIDPKLLKQLRPLQVRISKCDPLLENKIGGHYDAADVDYDYGLDKSCVYPYIYTFRHLRIKSEPSYMVNIQDEIKKACDLDESYVHWDSDETDSDLDLSEKVDTLTSLSIKTLFSPKLIGKVPKRRKKVKVDKAFDSILNSTSDFDTDMRLGIDNIINSLGDEKDKSVLDTDNSAASDKVDRTDNDPLFGDDNSPAITNDDFDSLFSKDASKTCNDSTADNKSEDSVDITSYASKLPLDSDDKVERSDIVSSKEQCSKTLENKDINESVSVSETNKTKDSDESGVCEEGSENCVNDVNKATKDVSKSSDLNLDNNIDLKLSVDFNAEENGEVNRDKVVKDDHTTDIGDAEKDSKDETAEANNDKTRVNGQSDLTEAFSMDDLENVSDTEIEDSRLMAALDKQIDEN